MSDTPTLAEKAQGLHISGGKSSSTTGIAEKPTGISSVRSAATAAAAAYAWRKASKSKDGRSRANLSVVPVRSSADGFTTPTTTISNGTPPPGGTGGRRLPSPGSSPSLLLAYVSASETSAEPLPTTADDIVDGTGMSVLGEARAKLATVERRTIDQWRAATAEARAASKVEKGEERIRQLEHQVLKLEDELRDSAAIEVSLYSVVAEHASSAHKVHTPARRLARFYIHLYKNWSPERRPSIARNIVSGLVLVVRACGNDVPRLTYWWSNVVVLRETISQSCEDAEVTASSAEMDGDVPSSNANGNDFAARALRSQQLRKSKLAQDVSQMLNLPSGAAGKDWRTCSMFLSGLMRVEAWIHGRVLESVWWQVSIIECLFRLWKMEQSPSLMRYLPL
jgi:hypothetical protein